MPPRFLSTPNDLYFYENDKLWIIGEDSIHLISEIRRTNQFNKSAAIDSSVFLVENAPSVNMVSFLYEFHGAKKDTIPIEVSGKTPENVFVLTSNDNYIFLIGFDPHNLFLFSFEPSTRQFNDLGTIVGVPTSITSKDSILIWTNSSFPGVFRSDGTTAGTYELYDKFCRQILGSIGGSIYFLCFDEEDQKIFKTDGIQTLETIDHNLGYNGSLDLLEIATFGEDTYFYDIRSDFVTSLWKIEAGESIDTFVVPATAPFATGTTLFANEENLFYTSVDSNSNQHLFVLNASDSEIEELIIDSFMFTSILEMIALGEQIVFNAATPGLGNMVWALNPRTRMFRPMIIPGTFEPRLTNHITANGDLLYFSGASEEQGFELWVTNLDTLISIDLVPGIQSSQPDQLTPVGNKLFFVAIEDNSEHELYVTEGTAETTRKVIDLNSKSTQRIQHLTASGSKLFFTAEVEGSGQQLWVTGGNEETTKTLTVFNTLSLANIRSISAYQDGVIFAADDGIAGHEIWYSDGTSEGTELLFDIWPGIGTSSPGPFYVIDTTVIFAANNGQHGEELWISQGTAETTRLLVDINEGSAAGFPLNFTHLKSLNLLLFTAIHPDYGREWYSIKLDDQSTSFPELGFPSSLLTYPNPTSRELMIESKKAISHIHVLDIDGNQMSTFHNARDSNILLDLSTIPQQVVLLEVVFRDGSIETKKVIKVD